MLSISASGCEGCLVYITVLHYRHYNDYTVACPTDVMIFVFMCCSVLFISSIYLNVAALSCCLKALVSGCILLQYMLLGGIVCDFSLTYVLVRAVTFGLSVWLVAVIL